MSSAHTIQRLSRNDTALLADVLDVFGKAFSCLRVRHPPPRSRS